MPCRKFYFPLTRVVKIMNAITFEVLTEKLGVEAICLAAIVCVISATVKTKFKITSHRTLTIIEVGISFALAVLYALIGKNGDMSGLMASGMSVAGVALTVCGIFCKDCKVDAAQGEKLLAAANAIAEGKVDKELIKDVIVEADLALDEEQIGILAAAIMRLGEEAAKSELPPEKKSDE